MAGSALHLVLAWSGLAAAEDFIAPPAVTMVDANGVDLISGSASFPMVANSIGGAGAMGLVATKNRSALGTMSTTMKSYIDYRFDPDGESQGSTTLVLNGQTYAFEGLGGYDYETTPLEESAGSFIYGTYFDTGEVVFIAPDGTRAYFNAVTFNSYPDPVSGEENRRVSMLKRIVYPNGEVVEYTYGGANLLDAVKVESSLGYALVADQPLYLANIKAYDLTQGGCTGFSCSAPAYDSQLALGREPTINTVYNTAMGSSTVTHASAAGDDVRSYTVKALYLLNGHGLYPTPKVTTYSGERGSWTYTHSFVGGGTPIVGVMTTTAVAPDGTKRIVKSEYQSGQVLSDQVGVNAQRPAGLTTTYAYTRTNGRGIDQKKITLPEGDVFEYAYDAYQNIIRRTHFAKGSTTDKLEITAGYSCRATATTTICNQPDWLRDEAGGQTDFTYDPVHGGVATRTAPRGANGFRPQTRYSYQQYTPRYVRNGASYAAAPVWRLKKTSTCRTQESCAGTADELVTEYEYEASAGYNHARLVSTTMRAGDFSTSSTTTFAYNGRGDVIATDGPLTGDVDLVQTRYDASRWLVGSTAADPASASRFRASKTTYRADGKPLNQFVGVVADRSDATFANAFQVLSRIENQYDSHGRVYIRTAYGTGGAYAQTQMDYTPLGQPSCVAVRMNPAAFGDAPLRDSCQMGTEGAYGPDRITNTVYDDLGRPVTVTGAYGTDAPIVLKRLTYTTNGLPATEADHANNVTRYAYDGFDRLKRVSYPPTAIGAGQANAADYEEYGYDSRSNRTSLRRRDGLAIGYGYDALNLPTSKTVGATASTPASTFTYGYDNFGDMTSAADSATGLSIQATYDAFGRAVSQVQPRGAVSYTYDQASRRKTMAWPDGFTVSYDYYDDGSPKTIRRLIDGVAAETLAAYAYDDQGRRTSLSRNGALTTYEYGDGSLLKTLTHELAGSGSDLRIDLTYNPAGQIVSRAASNGSYTYRSPGAVNLTYTVNGLNQLTAVGGVAVAHDGRGNLTSDGATTFAYDGQNRLTGSSSGASVGYDPVGRQQQVALGAATTRMLYDGDQLIAEFDGAGALLRRYVPGPGSDEPVAWYEYAGGASTRRAYVADERGSIIALVDESGWSAGINTYDDYGAPAAANKGRYQYTGQIWSAELGLYNYKARVYSPTLGRFLQTDPAGFIDGLNLYAYANGDPVNRRDPSGLDACPKKDRRNCVDHPKTETGQGEQPGPTPEQTEVDEAVVTAAKKQEFSDGTVIQFPRSGNLEQGFRASGEGVYPKPFSRTGTQSCPGGETRAANSVNIGDLGPGESGGHTHGGGGLEPLPGPEDGLMAAATGRTAYQISTSGAFAIEKTPVGFRVRKLGGGSISNAERAALQAEIARWNVNNGGSGVKCTFTPDP